MQIGSAASNSPPYKVKLAVYNFLKIKLNVLK
jgi:hypothetical protein